jgi:hypothetical protein
MSNVIELNTTKNLTNWNRDEFVKKYPFLGTNEKHELASDRYRLVNTANLIERMIIKFGFELSEDRILHEGSKDHGKHVIGLKHSDIKFKNITGVDPRLFLRTSHDRSCSLQFILGAMKFNCANGQFSGTKEYEIKKNHTIGLTDAKIDYMIAKAMRKFKKLAEDYEQLSIETMPLDMQMRFLQMVLDKRGKSLKKPYEFVNHRDLMKVHQNGDDNNSFFSVLNVIDENLFSTLGNDLTLKVRRPAENGWAERKLSKITNEKYIVDFKAWMHQQVTVMFQEYKERKTKIIVPVAQKLIA